LIVAEGAKTPVGVRVRGDPAGASAEEARRNAHGKRRAWSGNQRTGLKKHFIKDLLYIYLTIFYHLLSFFNFYSNIGMRLGVK
jgi:hypothetical protein